MKNKKLRVIGIALGVCLAVGLSGLCGYQIGRNPGGEVAAPEPLVEETLPESGPALKLSVVADDEAGRSVLLEENTENSFTRTAIREGFSQANIEVDGETMSLKEALESGRITQAEIGCLARLDAQNGYCQATRQTRNGLTHFTYQYPDFNLRVVYDVYVTPDGGEDLIDHILLYPVRSNEFLGAYTDFYDPVTWERTDLEDWGVCFTVDEATPTQATVTCQQAGGQQIGQLFVDWYYLVPIVDGQGVGMDRIDGVMESPRCEVPLNMGGETTFTLDWTEEYGPLPSGEYRVSLNVLDHFDESQVHPLMQDFHDWQIYDVMITVP